MRNHYACLQTTSLRPTIHSALSLHVTILSLPHPRMTTYCIIFRGCCYARDYHAVAYLISSVHWGYIVHMVLRHVCETLAALFSLFQIQYCYNEALHPSTCLGVQVYLPEWLLSLLHQGQQQSGRWGEQPPQCDGRPCWQWGIPSLSRHFPSELLRQHFCKEWHSTSW